MQTGKRLASTDDRKPSLTSSGMFKVETATTDFQAVVPGVDDIEGKLSTYIGQGSAADHGHRESIAGLKTT